MNLSIKKALIEIETKRLLRKAGTIKCRILSKPRLAETIKSGDNVYVKIRTSNKLPAGKLVNFLFGGEEE